jgi:hypothetical protein
VQYPCCPAVSGSLLIIGLEGSKGAVLVWGLETLDLRHTLLQSAGENVQALLPVEGGICACVGRDVVVWGRGA